jgi:hypothetical protein
MISWKTRDDLSEQRSTLEHDVSDVILILTQQINYIHNGVECRFHGEIH